MTRFSQIYLQSENNLNDSARFRKRFTAIFLKVAGYNTQSRVAEDVESTLGIDPPMRYDGFRWDLFFATIQTRDLLDCVTIIFNAIPEKDEKGWVQICNLLFREEGLRYRADDAGIVHFAVDEAHEVSRLSTLQALQAPRFAAVADAFSRANDAFMDPNGGGTRPIRETFEALEILLKLQFPKVPRLGAKEIRDNLGPFVESTYASDTTAKRAAQKILGSMAEWVDGAHFYRHGQGTEEPASMPVELQVAFVNEGASFIRWLATIATNSAA